MAEVLTPEEILAILLGEAERAPELEPVALRLSQNVLAGGVGTIDYSVPEGMMAVHRTTLDITSTYYDPLVTLSLLLEPGGEERDVTPTALPLTGAFPIDLGPAVVLSVGLRLTITNGSANPALVTLAATLVQMPRDYAQAVYIPLLREMRRRVEALVKAGAAPTPPGLLLPLPPITGPAPRETLVSRFQVPRALAWEELRRRFPPLTGPAPGRVLPRKGGEESRPTVPLRK